MKKWRILTKIQDPIPKNRKLVDLLLENRKVKTKKDKEQFLNPKLEDVTIEKVGIDKKELSKTLNRIKKAINIKEPIIVFGDYDVDGITGTAILWETLHEVGANVLPYIPNRVDEGYGLSVKGIENIINQTSNPGADKERTKKVSLIITVDNGIVANDAVEYANKQGIDVIITDHHVTTNKLPEAHSIVHTTKLCGAGVAYLLSKELKAKYQKLKADGDTHLELAALSTIADLVPLTGANRAIVKHGLKALSTTKRPGLLALFKNARIENKAVTPYEVGYIIGPRLNAAGRIDSAMDSLRLICTKDPERAEKLADQLELINRQRQILMKDSAEHAITGIKNQELGIKNLLFVAHESYQQGVIGLIAGRLVEEFYRPSIVLSIGESQTKASARSVAGFNIIEFLRSHADHFINVGGHPMAAGFTVETVKLGKLQEALEKTADEILTDELLTRSLKIDCELSLESISQSLYDSMQTLAPFGMGNPEPTFVCYGVTVDNFKLLGEDRTHLKLQLFREPRTRNQKPKTIEAIGFGMGEHALNLKHGDKIDIVYTIDENTWNGNSNIQLKIKDIKTHE